MTWDFMLGLEWGSSSLNSIKIKIKFEVWISDLKNQLPSSIIHAFIALTYFKSIIVPGYTILMKNYEWLHYSVGSYRAHSKANQYFKYV